MTHYLQLIHNTLKRIWLNVFWKNPAHLWAFKVTVSIAFLLIPSIVLFNNYYLGSSLALGAVAMASAETDVHPRGRLKSIGISLLLFFVTSSIVELLTTHPVIFGIALGAMIFFLTLVAGINNRLSGVSFGTLFFITYTMLGPDTSQPWFYQPLLYVLGAFFYSIVSLLLLYFNPLRLLRGELSDGFIYLAKYLEIKAGLFLLSNSEEQERIINKLAQQNIQLVQQIETCKLSLQSFSVEVNTKRHSDIDILYRKWFLLQELQERATSNHAQQDILSDQVKNRDIMEGFAQLMRQTAHALRIYAESLLTNKTYRHPMSLRWTAKALKSMIHTEKDKIEAQFSTLMMLKKSLSGLEKTLRTEDKMDKKLKNYSFYFQPSKRQPLSSMLTRENSHFRFAIRLTLCLMIGYIIMHIFNIEKGAWILLTSLIVCQQTYSATRQRLFHRVTGTLLGVVIGAGLIIMLPTISGQILMFLGAIYGFYYYLKKKYTLAVIFITIYVLASYNLLDGEGVTVMIPRIIDTLIGGFIAFLSVRFIWPNWQYKQIPSLLHKAVLKNNRYFSSSYHKSVTETQYLQHRLTAHNADNDLTMAWKDMWYEPKNKQHFQQKAFRLTDLNHALLSYISAFGVFNQHSTHPLSEEELRLCKYVNKILQFVAEIMSQKMDNVLFSKYIMQASKWEEEIATIKSNTESESIVLIHNIARELLMEAHGLIHIQEEQVS